MGLDGIEMIAAVEHHFGISIPDAEASRMRTVEDLYLLVLRGSTKQAAAESDLPCRDCGYNLRGCVSTRCPECGTVFVPYTLGIDDAMAQRTWKELVDLMAEQLCVPREKLRPGTRFIEDLRVG
ncbi:MAG: acyl carrier protein [Planctomycetota bacterium]